MNLKRRRESFESKKLFPNYNELYSLIMPHLKSNQLDKYNIKNLTERGIQSKINKRNLDDNSISIPSLPSVEKLNNDKKLKSVENSHTNRIFKLTRRPDYTDRSNSNHNYSDDKRIHLLNVKLKKSKDNSCPLNLKKRYINLKDIYPSINNISIISNKNKSISPIKNNSSKNLINTNINSYNQVNLKRNNSSSYMVRNDEYFNKYNLKKKLPIKLYKYKKKWNLPKSILFDKISGRYDKRNKRFIEVKGTKNYFPNYNCIYCDNTKSYVHYGKNKDLILKNLKIDITRKLISNLHNLMNSPTNSYSVIEVITKEKQKKKEEKINKLKEKFGPYYELIKKMKNK